VPPPKTVVCCCGVGPVIIFLSSELSISKTGDEHDLGGGRLGTRNKIIRSRRRKLSRTGQDRTGQDVSEYRGGLGWLLSWSPEERGPMRETKAGKAGGGGGGGGNREAARRSFHITMLGCLPYCTATVTVVRVKEGQ
jgi:hypothetical protein